MPRFSCAPDEALPLRDVIAFARFVGGHWTEQPVLVFTHWRSLSKDPGISPDTEHMDAESAAAQGVRAAERVSLG